MAVSTHQGRGLNLLSSLKYRESRIFWFGATIASIAQAAFLVSAGWLAFQLHGSGAVGLVTFATMLPLLIATPVGGLLADRMDRRTLVIGAQIVQGIVALVLGIQTVFGAMPFAELVPLVFLSGIARAVELPTVQTMLPSLVPPEELLEHLFAQWPRHARLALCRPRRDAPLYWRRAARGSPS